MVFALIAVTWANSPAGDSYQHFWHSKVSLGFGGKVFAMSLEHWVNDGLMAFFFLLVGLEIKRELLIGELASARRATLPFAAAIGGLAVPALLYASVNIGGSGVSGWGVSMATDIAFAVGVLALGGRSVPTSVKVFLLAIAIVDDLGAVLVIACFYTGQISLPALAVAGLFLFALIALNVLRVHRPLPYMLLGIGLWIATFFSGLHATIAGVLLAFTIPASRQIEEQSYVEYVRKMLAQFEHDAALVPDNITEDQSHALGAMEQASQAVQTPLARIEHALLKPVAFLVVPFFALANAGVDLRSGASSSLQSPVAWGIVVGLVIGKPAGILLASWVAIKTGLSTLPSGATLSHVVGVGVLCGIGFTMSLFVANLAFPDQGHDMAAAKIGILAASLISGIIGGAIIARSGGQTRQTAPR
jgi:NhaA family Na+:H+ antiporter